MRTFLEISPPNSVKDDIFAWQEQLASHLPQLKAVPRNALHVTLQFLGEVDETHIELLAHSLAQKNDQLASFPLHLKDWGTFPEQGKLRILWLGLGGNITALHTLQGSVTSTTAAVLEAREEPRFHPHITTFRARRRKDIALQEVRALTIPPPPQTSWTVSEFSLTRSFLSPSRPASYEALHRFPLRTS